MLPDSIWLEKVPRHGEDAQPIKVSNESLGTVIAVFDGLGGAGAAKIEQASGELLSEAQLAAHFLGRETIEYFESFQSGDGLEGIEYDLAEFYKRKLEKYNATLPRVKSKLKSSLSKQLPSTCCILIHDTASAKPDLNVIWAGDSRAYRVRTDGVLECLTPDHVKHRSHLSKLDYFVGNGDAMMSNYISASHKFSLIRKSHSAEDTVVAFVCSDGVFGAFDNHLHFEKMVLETLLETKTSEEFERYVDEHRSDDVSLQAIILKGPDQYREALIQRVELLNRALEDDNDPSAFFAAVEGTFPFAYSSGKDSRKEPDIVQPIEVKKKDGSMRIALASMLIGASLGLGVSAIAILTLTNLASRNQQFPLEALTQATASQAIAMISAQEAPPLALANQNLQQAQDRLTTAQTDAKAAQENLDQMQAAQDQANQNLQQAQDRLTTAQTDAEAAQENLDQMQAAQDRVLEKILSQIRASELIAQEAIQRE